MDVALTQESATTPAASHRITIIDTGEKFECRDGESILNAMVKLGRKGIPSGCHGGGCGVCKIHVEGGDYRAWAMSREHVSVKEEADGIALACRSFPSSDLSVKVLGKMRKAVIRPERKYGFV